MLRTIAVVLSLFCTFAYAADRPTSYVLIAPPRQGLAQANAVYGRIANFLARATGAPITFHYTSNWLTYMAEVRHNTAAIYFDGPSFIGWRIAHWHDDALVALSGKLNFVLIAKKSAHPFHRIQHLIGRPVCAFSPPNIGTLTIDSWFTNPERQPYIVVIHNFVAAARNVMEGSCVAALEPLAVFKHQDAQFPGRLRVAYRAPGLPNQAFSVSAAVPATLRHKIIAALLSPAGARATKPLRDMFGHKALVRVHNAAYLPYRKELHVMVGF